MNTIKDDGRYAVALATLKEVRQQLDLLRKGTLPRDEAITIVTRLVTRSRAFDELMTQAFDNFSYPTNSNDNAALTGELEKLTCRFENLLIGAVLSEAQRVLDVDDDDV